MTDFHEVLFPSNISYGSSGGPKFKTTVFTSDSGFEQRNIDWEDVRSEFDVSHAIKDLDQMEALLAFFMARRGKAFGFRYKDWLDFMIQNQQLGVGDGTTTVFQFIKTYTSAQTESSESWSYTRTLTKLNWNTVAGVTVAGDVVVLGTDYTLDENAGTITFAVAPAGPVYELDGMGHQVLDGGGNPIITTPAAAILVGYAEFHIPVRFDVDQIDVTQEFWNTESWPNIPLVEVRDWGEVVPQ